MTQNKTLREEESIEGFELQIVEVLEKSYGFTYKKTVKELLSLFDKAMDEAIGEDEVGWGDESDYKLIVARNDLRDKQRTRKENLLK